MPIDPVLYKNIRQMITRGFSQRAIARTLNCSRKTIAKYCEGAIPPDKRTVPEGTSEEVAETPLFKAVKPYLENYLKASNDSHHKQQMTAKGMWHALLKEGFAIGESTVRQYVRVLRNDGLEGYIPLQFEPGEAMQVDWGEAYIYLRDVRTKVSTFCTILPYSYAPFVAVFPSKVYECFFLGHQMAWDFYRGVACKCVYDNLRTAVLIGDGSSAVKQDAFMKFEAHYAFDSIFCNRESPWEKGGVENLVDIIRKIAFAPTPRVDSYIELQELVTERCVDYCNNHRIQGRKLSVKDAFAEERTKLMPLPLTPFDTARSGLAKVYSSSLFIFDTNRYSVPSQYIGQTISYRATPFEVIGYFKGLEIARHARSYEKRSSIYNPEHYLPLLERKPRAIDNAAPIKSGTWPKEIERFRELYRGKDINHILVRILLLGQEESKENLLWAVNMANHSKHPSLESIRFYLDVRKSQDHEGKPVKSLDNWFQVDAVNLNPYDRLMERDETNDQNE